MGGDPVRTIGTILLVCLSIAAKPRPSHFEQVRKSPESIWRTAGYGKAATFISKDGFALSNGKSTHNFRWSKEMGLRQIRAEDLVDLPVYELSGKESVQLAAAKRLRVDSPESRISILYYFGPRGFEFDIDIEPDVPVPHLELEFLDGELSIGSAGELLADGDPFLLRPAIRPRSGDSGPPARVRFELPDSHHVRFRVEGRSPGQALTIDPVIVYATYFGGAETERVSFIREMADGTVLFGGHTNSIDLPEGYLLPGPGADPRRSGRICFIARLSAETRSLVYVSYIGGGSSTYCSSFDVDESERVLIAGFSDAYTLPTSGAEISISTGSTDAFLARVSADGKQLQYATYLRLSCATSFVGIRHGAADTAFLVGGCRYGGSVAPRHLQPQAGFVNILRYDIAARRVTDLATFGSSPEEQGNTVKGIEIGPSGTIHIFGQTLSVALPLRNPYQSAPPTEFKEAGFVAGVAPDLRSVVYSTYVGGQGKLTSVLSVTPGTNSIWVAGQAWSGSIPGIVEARPDNPDVLNAPFALELPEKGGAALHSFYANDGNMTDAADGAVLLTDGKFCLTGSGNWGSLEPGTAATRYSNITLLVGCLMRERGGWFSLNGILGRGNETSRPTAVSKSGGIWSATTEQSQVDAIPYALKAGAFSAFPLGMFSDILIQRIEFGTPKPELLHPPFVELRSLPPNTRGAVYFDGRGFTRGMALEVGGKRFPLTLSSSATAAFEYERSTMTLPAGIYDGRLVIPTTPEITSEPFRVVIRNAPPSYRPIAPSSNRRIFFIKEPFYEDTEVTFNGNVLPKLFENGLLTVEVPESLATPGTGEFVVRNPSPGGGIQKQSVQFHATGSVLEISSTSPAIRFALEYPRFDSARRLAYGMSFGPSTWYVSCTDLLSGRVLRSAIHPKDGATTPVDAALSTDGNYFYIIDNLLRVTRYETAGLTADLRFSIVPDAGQRPNELRFRIMAIEDSPESLLALLPSGHMVIYDRDLPRPYRSSDFPSAILARMEPVLVTRNAVYAIGSGDTGTSRPCLVRYPVDALGFGAAEDICNPGGDWGKYAEMRRYGDRLILQGRHSAIRILPGSVNTSLDQSPSLIVPSQNLEIRSEIIVPYDGYGLRLYRLDSGEPAGIYPPGSPLRRSQPLALIDGEILVFLEYVANIATVLVETNFTNVTNWNP